MKNILFILLLGWLLTACSQPENAPPPSQLSVWADSLEIALPAGLDQLDNLIVVPPDQKPHYEIAFVREQEFLPDDDMLFSDLSAMVVDDLGRVHINNGPWIHSYEPDGTYLSVMGGIGRGPGEHSAFGGKEFIMHQNRLLTYDTNLHRINIFSLETLRTSGTLVMDSNELSVADAGKGMYPGLSYVTRGAYFSLNDSLLLVRFTEPFQMSRQPSEGYKLFYYECDYYAVDYEGNLIPERIIDAECPVQMSNFGLQTQFMPFFTQPLLESNGNGRIYTATSAHFFLKIHDVRGNVQKALYFPLKTAPLNKENFIDNSTNQVNRERIQNTDLPSRWPVLKHVLIDDEDRIWAATITENEEELRWIIVDEDGTLIAEFDWPGDRMAGSEQIPIKAIKNGAIYTYEESPGSEMDPSQRRFVRYRYTLTSR